MTMITPSYLGETIEYSSLHACRSTLEDPTGGRCPAKTRRGRRRLWPLRLSELNLRSVTIRIMRTALPTYLPAQKESADQASPRCGTCVLSNRNDDIIF